MKKILVLGPSPQTRGGITSVINSYRSEDVWDKWNCTWISTYIDKSPILKIFYFLGGLLRYLWLLPSANVVHIHLSESTSARRKYVYFKLALFLNKKTILHFHAFSPDTTIFGPYASLYKKMFNLADIVICLSNYWCNIINEIVYDKSKVKVLYNPCMSVSLDSQCQKENIVLFAGTLNARKGYQDLIRAFSRIKDLNPSWKVVFAGNGEIEIAKELCEELNSVGQIEFKGWVKGAEKHDLFRKSSIFCLPSYAEGFPMAVLDAWSYGLPVVTTPVGGLPDVLEDGFNALVFNPGDIDALANHLNNLINNVSLQERLSSESLKLSQTRFSIGSVSKELDLIYTGLIARK